MSGSLQLGVFARVFPVQPAASLATAIAEAGFDAVQLNLSAIGEPTIPGETALTGINFTGIRRDFEGVGLQVWGLSGSYNTAHPDPAFSAAQTVNAARLVRHAPELGAVAVTLCTGSRDPEDMWRAHPDNDTEAAWHDLLTNLGVLIEAAEDADVLLGVEPEPGNVVSGTDAALRLIDSLGERANRIGFILDPANLVATSAPEEHDAILQDAFARLGSSTICVHAKDVVSWDDRLAGAAGLDFARIRELHAALPNAVPIIVQDATPANIGAVRDLVAGRS